MTDMTSQLPAVRMGNRFVRPSLSALLVAGALSGCSNNVATPFSATPEVRIASHWAAYQGTNPGMVDNGWVDDFQSAALKSLVDEAIANNQDLRAAYYRMVEAGAIARQAQGAGLPSVNFGSGATRSGAADGSNTSNAVDLDLRLSWEADIWGRVSGQRAAAQMDMLSEAALFEGVRQSIAAQVADAWIGVAGLQEKLSIVSREISSRQRSLSNVEQRVAAQTLLSVDSNLIRANLEQSKARQAQLVGQLDSSVRVLEVLLGRYPAAELRQTGGLPALPARVPAGLPSELLQRRPDLVARERAVAAAFHRTAEARAARLPRLTLSSSLTGEGGTLGNALDPANIVWNLVGNIFVPLLDGQSRAEAVNARTARQAAALAEYGATALRAFQEVEDAMGTDDALRHRIAHLQSAANQLELAISSEQARYDAGEVDLTRVEDARVQYYNILQSVADARTDRLRNRVKLYLALGGSFDHNPAVQPAGN